MYGVSGSDIHIVHHNNNGLCCVLIRSSGKNYAKIKWKIISLEYFGKYENLCGNIRLLQFGSC